MKLRKMIVCIVSLVIVFSALFVLPAFAEDACDIAGVDDPLICGTKESNEEKELQLKIKGVLETIYLWVGIIAVVVIVIGGIKYMTSSGEAEKTKSAKNTIMYAVIGLIITILAFAITEFFIGALEGRTPDETSVDDSGGNDPSNEDVEVRSVQIVGLSTIAEGEEYGLRAKIIPDYAKDKTVTWTSSDTSVATVSSTGRVKTLKPGTTTITVTTKNGKTATKVIIVPKPIEASSVVFVNQVSSIQVGKKETLEVKVLPVNAKDKSITWGSSDLQVLSISKKGVIKGLKKGSATVTATTKNGKSASMKITVKEKKEEVSNDKVKTLQDLVAAYADSYFTSKKSKAKAAYKEAASKIKTGRSGNIFRSWGNGSSCCAYVITVMRTSNWDSKFKIGSPDSIHPYLSKSSKWIKVTNKIKSNKDAKPGDVIVGTHKMLKGTKQGHILLFHGDIKGFSSKMSSASISTPRTPMADKQKNITTYIKWGYDVFRLKEE